MEDHLLLLSSTCVHKTKGRLIVKINFKFGQWTKNEQRGGG